jgi:hypothetical protein
MAIEVREPGQGISNTAGIHKKYVQQAVVVVVQERDASGHGLNQVFSGGRGVAENKINTLGRVYVEACTGARGLRLRKQAGRVEQRERAGFGESCRRQIESLSSSLGLAA